MIGSPLAIAGAFLFVTLGAIIMGVVFEGHLLTGLRAWERLLLIPCSLCIFIPNPVTRIIGLGIAVLFLFSQIMARRRLKGNA